MTATVVAGSDANAGGGADSMSGMAMPSMTAQQMADAHKAGVEVFPAETQGTGNQVLQPTMDGSVKVFTLTASEVTWEVSPGVFKDAMAYNGQIPGPQLDVELRRRGSDRPAEPAFAADGLALPRDDGAERDGRCSLHHPGSGHAGSVLV